MAFDIALLSLVDSSGNAANLKFIGIALSSVGQMECHSIGKKFNFIND
jgi:hypothetical protein